VRPSIVSWPSLVAIHGLVGCFGLLAPSAYANELQIFVNDPMPWSKPMDQCVTPHCRSVLGLIEGAQHTLDIAIYGLRNQAAITKAILAARERGVRVRIVVDKDIDNVNYYSSTVKLEEAFGADIKNDFLTDQRTKATKKPYDPNTARCANPPGFPGPVQCLGYDLGDSCLLAEHASEEDLVFKGEIMHNKYLVADGRRVWLGSTNISDSCSGGYNANIAAYVDHPDVGRWYTEEFEQMWRDGRFHNEKVAMGGVRRAVIDADTSAEVYFSPQDDPMERAVRPLLQSAKERIEVAVFYLTHKGITSDLIAAHRRGVKVRVIIDATSAVNGYTKHELLRAAGIPVKVENWGGKMHMKSASVDGKHVIVGSMNWTSAGTGTNDENTMVVHDAKLGAEFDAAFEKLWKSIPDKWLQGRPDAEGLSSPVACKDGIDNDYDHLADAQDPGCGANPPPLPALPPHRVVPKEEGHGLIKGVVNEEGRKVFYGPNSRYYDRTAVNPALGGRWFCSEGDAWDAGFKRSRD
jgi:phosphatidylserine/phosphatidylglycerophosphate/cardiolipin synthase-like enzyme